ncbi:MAG: hypothetical protein OEV42_05520 [Deltaproteobacteria bacterium]|nr:hypothetical protein [Deltaproteobacteria bacterium]
MKKSLNFKFLALTFLFFTLLSYGCLNNKAYENKAHVVFKWQLHTENTTSTGWIKAHGWVINKGSKRADWVTVTIYSIDPETNIVVDKKMIDVQGTGPNKRSVEPGAAARFDARLNSKRKHHYKYRREVTWVEAAQ